MGIIPNLDIVSANHINSRREKRSNIIDGRNIIAKHDCYSFRHLSFFNENLELLEYPEFKKYKSKLNRRKAWIDENYIYLPIMKLEKIEYEGDVFNLEVENDNTYVTNSFIVHNCWTPWFSVLGSNSGYNSVDECFEDHTKNIHAIETGLSSDPPMNWRVSSLDKFALVSNSDSHSPWPWRIGRECNVFQNIKSYKELINAIQNKDKSRFLSTIEVDPSYGKYHFTGHRNCGVSMDPKEATQIHNICPVCRKKMTVGVLERVEELADRQAGFRPPSAIDYVDLIPLAEIIAHVCNKGLTTKYVWERYMQMINIFKSEFNILIDAPESELIKFDPLIGSAVIKARKQEVKIKPGFDGEYGVPIFNEVSNNKNKIIKKQKSLNDF